MPKIRKDERRAEKLHKVIYGKQNIKKINEKEEKIKANIPNIKTRYELKMEKNNNYENENKINDEDINTIKNEEPPIKDWWGDIFKK